MRQKFKFVCRVAVALLVTMIGLWMTPLGQMLDVSAKTFLLLLVLAAPLVAFLFARSLGQEIAALAIVAGEALVIILGPFAGAAAYVGAVVGGRGPGILLGMAGWCVLACLAGVAVIAVKRKLLSMLAKRRETMKGNVATVGQSLPSLRESGRSMDSVHKQHEGPEKP